MKDVDALAKEVVAALVAQVRYWVDKGAPRQYVAQEIQRENAEHTPEISSIVIDRMVETGELTQTDTDTPYYGKGFIVVTERMPRTAAKIRKLNAEGPCPY